jgi:predicted nicotinamide N-methyase
MDTGNHDEIRAYGVRVLLTHHPQVRRIRRARKPVAFGDRVWGATYVLMDYLSRRGVGQGANVMEIGCGCGLAGIYCASRYGSSVTGVDADPRVFPLLDLQARANGVRIGKVQSRLEWLSRRRLDGTDVMIGADVCFWDDLAASLKNLIHRALRAGVSRVIVADPGRPPFYAVADHFVERAGGIVLPWSARHPRYTRGFVLDLDGTSQMSG